MSKLFYLFFHGREGALNQYLIMPLGMDPINWMMDPNFIMSSLVMQAVWRWTGVAALFFLCGLESIPRWHFELAKLEGFSFFAKLRFILIPGIRNLALFIVIFLIVDGVAAFSGAYTLLGGSGGMLDAGLLLVTYVYQVAFPGGSGRFDLPGAASMSLLVAPLLGGMLFILLKTKTFSLGHDEVYLLSYYCNLSCNEHLSICLDVFFLFQDESEIYQPTQLLPKDFDGALIQSFGREIFGF